MGYAGRVSLPTPLRRLQGITYWVIENPGAIGEFINTNIRREWEADVKSVGRNPRDDPWLQRLSARVWRLEIVDTSSVKLDLGIMNYASADTGYSFTESLARRTRELRKAIEAYGSVIWPVIITGENSRLVDGYCRLTTLREKGVTQTYAYLGGIRTDGG